MFYLCDYFKDIGATHYNYNVSKDLSFSNLALIDYYPLTTDLCTFIEDARYLSYIDIEKFKLVLVSEELQTKVEKLNVSFAVVDNPRTTFFRLHNRLCSEEEYVGASKKNNISPSATISKHASIPDNDVVIGDNVIIEEFVKIYPRVSIGENSIIRSGSVIGGTGFEYKYDSDQLFAVEHVGEVQIGKNVEIKNNVCIDRGLYPWSKTVIGDFCKIDNLVQIAHGVQLGQRVLVVASATFNGRVVVGDDVWIGPHTTIRNGLTIASNSRINIGSVVTKNVKTGESVTGNFAINHDRFIDFMKTISH